MTSESPSFVAGGGDLGERIRAFDWSATPLGPLCRMAAEPQDGGADHAHLAAANLDWLGQRADLPL